jgi:hypothetical protein
MGIPTEKVRIVLAHDDSGCGDVMIKKCEQGCKINRTRLDRILLHDGQDLANLASFCARAGLITADSLHNRHDA